MFIVIDLKPVLNKARTGCFHFTVLFLFPIDLKMFTNFGKTGGHGISDAVVMIYGADGCGQWHTVTLVRFDRVTRMETGAHVADRLCGTSSVFFRSVAFQQRTFARSFCGTPSNGNCKFLAC